MARKPKFVLKSLTIQGSLVSMAGAIAIAPALLTKGSEMAQILGYPEAAEFLTALVGLLIAVGPVLTTVGRLRGSTGKDLWTPHGMPGPDRPERHIPLR
ncbi:MAG: hypothetical protein ACRC2U_09270 [Aeromonas sp.]